MNRKNNNFNDCLERSFQGEELERCLEDLSEEETNEMRGLLQTASLLTQYTETIKPRPEFAARMQIQLKEACTLRTTHSRKIGISDILNPIGRWAVSMAFAVVMALFTFTGGFALAETVSKNTTPGQTLYPLKLATEKIRAAVILSNTQKPALSIPSEVEVSNTNGIGDEGDGDNPGNAVPLVQSPVFSDSGNPGKAPPLSQSPAFDDTDAKSKHGQADSTSGQQSAPGPGDNGNPGKAMPLAQSPIFSDNITPGKAVPLTESPVFSDNVTPGKAQPPAQLPPSDDADTDRDDKDNHGQSDTAPGHQSSSGQGDNDDGGKPAPPAQSPPSDDTHRDDKSNHGQSDSTPGHQSSLGQGDDDNGANAAPPDQTPPSDDTHRDDKGKRGQSDAAPGHQSSPGRTSSK